MKNIYFINNSLMEKKKKNNGWLILLFFLLLGGLWYLIYSNVLAHKTWEWKDNNQKVEQTSETQKEEKKPEIDYNVDTSDNPLTYTKEDEFKYWHTEGKYGTNYTPWYHQWDWFDIQYNEEKIKNAYLKKKKELQNKHPDMTDEEAKLLIWDINGYGWELVGNAENWAWTFGSKFFTNPLEVREEFDKRLGTRDYLFILKNKDWFVQSMELYDMWYDLDERNEEVNDLLVKAWDDDIRDLEQKIKQSWGEIYTPNPKKDLNDKSNSQKDVYFYQVVNNFHNTFKRLAEINKDYLSEKEYKDLSDVKFVFAKHWNNYRVYPVWISNSVAQRIGFNEFNMSYLYVDNNNWNSTFKNEKKWEAMFGSFIDKKDLKQFQHELNEWINLDWYDKPFTFSKDDSLKEEWEKLTKVLINQRITMANNQADNDMVMHALPDWESNYGDLTLRCYVTYSDDSIYKMRNAEWRRCLTYKDWEYVGIVDEKDTRVVNSNYNWDKNLIAPTWFKKSNSVKLTEEQIAQNKRVDELRDKYLAEEAAELLKNNEEQNLEYVKSFGYTSLEEYNKAKERENNKIKNSNYKYNKDFDFQTFKETPAL